LPGLEVSTSNRPPSKRMKKVARILQPDEHMLLEALSLQTSAYQRKFKIDNRYLNLVSVHISILHSVLFWIQLSIKTWQ